MRKGKKAFLDMLNGNGLNSINVMLEHLIRGHPLVFELFLKAFRDDLEETADVTRVTGVHKSGESSGDGKQFTTGRSGSTTFHR